jgi:transglutaminase-like putative cysteine protease
VIEATRAPLRLTAAAAVASATATLGLERLVQSGPWLTACFTAILVVGAIGHLARSGRLPRPVVILAQIVGGLCAVTLLRVPTSAIGFFIPGPGAFHALAEQISAGRTNIANESPPAAATPGITTILVLVCAAFAILIDAIAVTYRRAVLAGLPLLTVYLIPATRKPGGLSWLAFIFAAVGYLSLVSADGHDRLARWGRALGSQKSSDPLGPANNPHSALSRRITSTAVVAALVLPWFIPTLPGFFNGGGGSGGSGTISINQSIDLRRSLTSTSAIPLLRYSTNSSDARGQYLRMSVLDQFDGNAWTVGSGGRMLPFSGNVAIPGLTSPAIARRQESLQISVVGEFSFGSVPAPYAPTAISGIANPTYDSATLAITAGDSATRSRLGQQYNVVSTQLEPTATQLNNAPAATNPSLARYLERPTDFPADVTALAKQITANAGTPFLKAEALQNYFLNNFTYSTSVPAGDGNSAIENFLKSKIGFCQQFAGTMAAMARALGIPAVVAVGFTPGTQQSDGSYQVTTHDAHSWPMLYFSGIGWVRFEPTPTIAGARGEAPAYTKAGVGGIGSLPSSSLSPGATVPKPTNSANSCSGKFAQLTGECANAQSGHSAAAPRAFASWGPFGVIPRWFQRWFLSGTATEIGAKLFALVLLLLATVPALGRLTRRRNRRVLVKQTERYLARVATEGERAAGTPPARFRGRDGAAASPMAAIALAAWAELRECADDLGYEWAESDTPRQAALRLAQAARFDEGATAAMGRVTTLTEQARYADAPRYDQPALRALPRDLRMLRSAMAENASRADRIKAAILPASSLARLREGRDRMTASFYRGQRNTTERNDDAES